MEHKRTSWSDLHRVRQKHNHEDDDVSHGGGKDDGHDDDGVGHDDDHFPRVTVVARLFIKTTTWSSRSLALSVMGENRKKGSWTFQQKYKQL